MQLLQAKIMTITPTFQFVDLNARYIVILIHDI